MKKEFISLTLDDVLSDALKLFYAEKVSTIPIMTPFDLPLGVLTEEIFIKTWVVQRAGGLKNPQIKSLKDFILPATLLDESDSFPQVVKAVIDSECGRAIVKNESGKFCGIISPQDIISYLANKEI